jgi:hypothetical protein
MDTPAFLASLAVAVAAPLLALAWLRPILLRVLHGLCDAEGSAEFWIRCATLLAVTGTLLLVMVFGDFDAGATLVAALRRVLFLTFAGVFASVALISRNVWNQARANAAAAPQAPGGAQ